MDIWKELEFFFFDVDLLLGDVTPPACEKLAVTLFELELIDDVWLVRCLLDFGVLFDM